jgi:uncharacterized protein involved in outer membrane biogenesis
VNGTSERWLSTRARAIWLRIGIGVGVMLLLLGLLLALIDWNLLKGPIERIASARSGRTVTLGGPLEVHLWSLAPSFSVSDLTVGNPPWEPGRPMAKVKRLTVHIQLLPLLKGSVVLPRVLIEEPDIHLHSRTDGRANWTFQNKRPINAPAPPPPRLPVVRDFEIQNGKLTLLDDVRKLTFDAQVFAHEKKSSSEPKPFQIQGKGGLNGKPFMLHISGGPLINLDPGDPYPFDLEVKAGDILVNSSGVVPKPFDLSKLDFKVTLSGADLADFYYLTQLALPNTPPFKLQASIHREGSRIEIRDIAGVLGGSDLAGAVAIDASLKRPKITGDLISKRLRLGDLAASLGGTQAGSSALTANSAQAPAQPKSVRSKTLPETLRLFPDAKLQVVRVRAMDADVHYAAQSIEAGSFPLKHVDLHINIDAGVLGLQPFAFELPEGRLSGSARIDARAQRPHTELDLRIRDVRLDQFKGKKPGATAALGGILHGRVKLEGTGASVHDFVAGAHGSVTAILPDGEIRAAFAELTGINVTRGLGLILKGDQERAAIRCGVAEFRVQDGTMRAQNIVFDTRDVLITAGGEVRLGPEELDLAIKGQPKKLRLVRLRTPVELKGHLRKPVITVDVGKTLQQGGIAAAFGALVAPLAAVIAFVDPGLAKDANCADLLAEATNRAVPAMQPIARQSASHSKPQTR